MQIEVPEISKNELTPISIKLLNIIDQYVQIIEQKNVLIRQLKDENPRPKLKPSTLERNNIDTANNRKKNNFKRGDEKKKKNKLKVTNKKKLKKPKARIQYRGATGRL